MDLKDESKRRLREWAAANIYVRQLWIFGSRGRGDARENSDVDIALAMMPGDGRTEASLGAYLHLEVEWKQQLKAIVGHDVSIGVIVPGEAADERVRREGVLLWARENPAIK
jgi:predicted nucleotidyltransferase